jgi:hypothetical protein
MLLIKHAHADHPRCRPALGVGGGLRSSMKLANRLKASEIRK